jgi:hypothetical protein
MECHPALASGRNYEIHKTPEKDGFVAAHLVLLSIAVESFTRPYV